MKYIFLDRDGVINKDPMGGYITRWSKFEFLPGALEAISKLTQSGYKIIIISNQAGVGKGLFTEGHLETITRNMIKEIRKAGGDISAYFYCTHTKEENCDCKKPRTGMFRKAIRDENFDFSNTYFIGDGLMDIEAGKAVGCKVIFLLCGKTKLEDLKNINVRPDFIKKNLKEAVDCILEPMSAPGADIG